MRARIRRGDVALVAVVDFREKLLMMDCDDDDVMGMMTQGEAGTRGIGGRRGSCTTKDG